MQYGMVIDLKKCFGCQTCATSCKLANNLPKGIAWNTVKTIGGETIDTCAGTYPNCTLQHQPVSCQQCADAACVSVCPTGATYRDEATGIIMLDTDTCIGCQSCIAACPYDVRRYLESEPEYSVDFAVGFQGVKKHVAGTVGKCTFCDELVAEGRNPICVDACIGYARYFGDLDDPNSEVSQLLASREHEQLLAEFGTNPNVYYLK